MLLIKLNLITYQDIPFIFCTKWTVLGVNGQHSRTVLSRVEVEIRRDQGRVQTRRHLMKNTCAKGRPLKQQIVTPTAVQVKYMI